MKHLLGASILIIVACRAVLAGEADYESLTHKIAKMSLTSQPQAAGRKKTQQISFPQKCIFLIGTEASDQNGILHQGTYLKTPIVDLRILRADDHYVVFSGGGDNAENYSIAFMETYNNDEALQPAGQLIRETAIECNETHCTSDLGNSHAEHYNSTDNNSPLLEALEELVNICK
ncbi:hypothetical protein [Ruegeria sp. HKCCE3926]|uniref:hypothetical protein n=1 Tax=Ruegeria sp. HKCCE3926 TaxID=2794831 RepID=UPI001AE16C27|nr:hypothetical protein [Ruegeria sp. HKCCE3926]